MKGTGLKRERNHSTGKWLFYWKQHSSGSHQSRTRTKLATKMQFYRHTRAGFVWVRNIPAVCQ